VRGPAIRPSLALDRHEVDWTSLDSELQKWQANSPSVAALPPVAPIPPLAARCWLASVAHNKLGAMTNLRHCKFVAVAVLLAGPSASDSRASASNAVDETRPTESALRAVADHWQQAEIDGDVAYLEQLLLPEYRSISHVGVATVKAKILQRAKQNKGSEKWRREVAAYLQSHPTEMSIVIHRTTGIVSYFNPARGVQMGVRSSDIFVYENARWHAVYSQHSVPDAPVQP